MILSFYDTISDSGPADVGTLCVGVLDHLVRSMRKKTEPSGDASVLQADTSSKTRWSASHVQVSSYLTLPAPFPTPSPFPPTSTKTLNH